MGLVGALNLPSHTLHSRFQAVLQQNSLGLCRRSCESRLKVRDASHLRRALLNCCQAPTPLRSGRLFRLHGVRQHRRKMTRASADENDETEEDRKDEGGELTPPNAYENYKSVDEPKQEVVNVVPSPPPSIEAFTEIDSITFTRSTSSSPVRSQPQKSGRGGGGLQWILGPLALLITGALPALWLPSPSLFSGSATAGLLALAGLDVTFNLGATAFFLMADSSARGSTEDSTPSQSSIIPLGYKVWSFLVNLVGLMAPIALIVASRRGVLQFQPALPVLPAAALLGPYTLLMVVQWLAEVLVWKWQSPVWPVLPLVYQAYRVLQLTRGIELGAALEAPAWLVEAVKGLVAWWVFVLGMQIMWVAWLVGTIQNGQARHS